jgi:hypothetical protein
VILGRSRFHCKAIITKILTYIDPHALIVMPKELPMTVLCVCSLYGLGKVADISGWNPLGPAGGRTPVPPGWPQPGRPGPQPPASDAPPSHGGRSADDGAGRGEKFDSVAAACEQAGEFGLADIDAATGLGYETVRHWVGVLIAKHWVEKVRHGKYRWLGRADG